MLQSIQGNSGVPQKNPLTTKVANKNGDSVQFSSTKYSSDSVSISYKNDSGEELTIEMEHVEFKSTNLSRYSDAEKAHWDDVVKQIKEEYKKFKEDFLSGFLNGDVESSKKKTDSFDSSSLTPEELTKKTDELIEKMPEAWRPEAVANRIVQFVTAFYGRTEAQGKDFYNLALSSINDGFQQAGDQMGKVPGEVESVISRTREMIMAKLDKWAKDQGIINDPVEQSKTEIDLTA